MAEDGCPAHMQLLEFCQSGDIHCISSEQSKKHIVIGNQSRAESVLQAGPFVFLSSILIYLVKSSDLKQDVKKDIFQIQEISFNFRQSTNSKTKICSFAKKNFVCLQFICLTWSSMDCEWGNK